MHGSLKRTRGGFRQRRALATCAPFAVLLACSNGAETGRGAEATEERRLADVLDVETSGSAGAYTFRVRVSSPDTGCERYADWWEVMDTDGSLLYRRVLRHSHTVEQPFSRVGGPVEVAAHRTVWVRAHMHPDGYGGRALRGSVERGFEPAPLAADFAGDVAQRPPLPQGCDF